MQEEQLFDAVHRQMLITDDPYEQQRLSSFLIALKSASMPSIPSPDFPDMMRYYCGSLPDWDSGGTVPYACTLGMYSFNLPEIYFAGMSGGGVDVMIQTLIQLGRSGLLKIDEPSILTLPVFNTEPQTVRYMPTRLSGEQIGTIRNNILLGDKFNDAHVTDLLANVGAGFGIIQILLTDVNGALPNEDGYQSVNQFVPRFKYA